MPALTPSPFSAAAVPRPAAGRGMRWLAVACGFALAVSAVSCLPDPDAASPGPMAGPVEPVVEVTPEPAYVPDPTIPEFTVDKTAEVSVLCYHDFTTGASTNPMVMPIDTFRTQMTALRDAGIAVIGMDDFLAWRAGERDIPSPSVLVTIDDGWESAYNLALPVLRELGYPFTLFLYSRYIDGGGRALTTPMVEEMVAQGVSIGSHSFSHPSPGRVRAATKQGGEALDEFIEREMADSKAFLEERFGVPVRTYAYPGGIFTERMAEYNAEAGWYDALFTINPAKVGWDTPAGRVHRYVIHGADDQNFKQGTTFPGRAGNALDLARSDAGDVERATITTHPEDQAEVDDRRPLISADFSAVQNLDPESLRMRVSGFGQVPATFDPETKLYSWRPRQRLRAPGCDVVVRFAHGGPPRVEEAVAWRFTIDRRAAYLSELDADALDGL